MHYGIYCQHKLKGAAAIQTTPDDVRTPLLPADFNWEDCLTLPAVGTACLSEVPAKALDIMVAAISIRYLVFRDPWVLQTQNEEFLIQAELGIQGG